MTAETTDLIFAAQEAGATSVRVRTPRSMCGYFVRLTLVFRDAAACTNFFLSDWCDPFNGMTPIVAHHSRGNVMVALVDVR